MKHIIIKLTKVKETAQREKSTVTNKGNSLRLKVDLIAKTLQVSGDWDDIFKMLREKKQPSNNTIPEKLSFNHERRIKAFLNTQKLQEFITTSPNS